MPSMLPSARPKARLPLVALLALLLAAAPLVAGAPAGRLTPRHSAAAADPARLAAPDERAHGDGDARQPGSARDAGDSGDDGGESDGGPRQAEQWFVQQRAYPLHAIPAGARSHALAQLAALRRRVAPTTPSFGATAPLGGGVLTTGGTWSPVGSASHLSGGTSQDPFGDPLTTEYGAVGGRVTALAIAPTAPYTVYAGTAGGGVWTSPDGGATWTPRTDGQASLAIGAMAVAPTAPYTVYALTGEGNFSADSYYGAGLLQSTTGGASWTLTGSALTRLTASRLAVDPLTPTTLYAAMGPGMSGPTTTIGQGGPGGLYRSTDGGATWTPTLQAGAGPAPGCSDPAADVPATDVAVASTGVTTTVYAALGDNNPALADTGCAANGLYRSVDDGATWTRLGGFDLATGTNGLGRIAVATMSANPNVVYAAVESVGDGTLQGLYESTDGGATWQARAIPDDRGASQYWYDLYVAVDPTVSSTVYLGGIDAFKSTDAGASWTNLTNSYSGGSVHPDQHALTFFPGSNTSLYIGNDGGVYSSADAGASWSDRSNGLGAIQLYGASVSAPAQGMVAYGGSQDNDVAQDPGTGMWTSVVGGDGGLSAIDPTDVNTVYAETQEATLWKTTNGGATWDESAGPDVSANNPYQDYYYTGRAAFITPFALDQSNPQRLLMGTYRLWESDDGGSTWFNPGSGQDLTGGDSTAYISALAIAPSAHATTTYVGSSNGHVQTTTNGGGSWSDGAGIPDRYVTSIAVDPGVATTAWAGLSGFNAATPAAPGHVFQTTDGGQTWHDVSGNLPDVPVNSLAVDGSGSVLFAGTDVGVFVSANDGGTWTPLGSGLPNVPVFQLVLRADGTLYAATHGRGLWAIPVGVTVTYPPATPTATASGTSTPQPADTTAPTDTPTPTATHTPLPTSTGTPVPSNTPTSTATPTASNPSPTAAVGSSTPQVSATRPPATDTPRAAPRSTATPRRQAHRGSPQARCTPTAATVHVDASVTLHHARLRLTVAVTGDARGRGHGTLHFADPSAHLSLSSATLTSLRVTLRGATITGWRRVGRERESVAVVVTAGHPAHVDIRVGRYHRAGALRGTLRLQPAISCPCPPAALSVHVQATLAVNRHTILALRADVAGKAGHVQGRIRWRDPAAHVTLNTTALTAATATGQRLTLAGWRGTGKRRQRFTLILSGGHAPRMDLRLGRYHRSGSLSGTVRLRLPAPC